MKLQKLIFWTLAFWLVGTLCIAQSFKEVIVSSPGELENSLGDDWDKIDSIVVKGTINKADFKMLYKCSLLGELKVINLGQASVEGNKIPEYALFYPDIYFSYLPLERIILPENITEIEEYAFASMDIKKINLPASLKKLSDGAFWYCWKLESDPLIIPEGVTVIPQMCFFGCNKIRNIVFPQSLKTIEDFSFYYTPALEELNLPEGLDSIGWGAFQGSFGLKEVVLPETALHLGNKVFDKCYGLRKIKLPQGIMKIPSDFLNDCFEMETIDIPDRVTTIGTDAFEGCSGLSYVRFPKNLKIIESGAFRQNNISEIVFPSTLELVGRFAFNESKMLEKVYCPAQRPPSAEFDDPNINEGSDHAHPFVSEKEMTLYVPVGTGDLYRNADGWKSFDHIVEIENFPSSCGVTFATECKVSSSNREIRLNNPTGRSVNVRVYDMNGRMIRQESVMETGCFAVSPGIYLVRVGNKTERVLVR